MNVFVCVKLIFHPKMERARRESEAGHRHVVINNVSQCLINFFRPSLPSSHNFFDVVIVTVCRSLFGSRGCTRTLVFLG